MVLINNNNFFQVKHYLANMCCQQFSTRDYRDKLLSADIKSVGSMYRFN